MILTKPHFIFFPEAWDVSYAAAAEPDASTPAWTLIGVDHASATGNVLTIASAGTDQNAYSLAWGTHVATDVLWAYVTLQIETGGTTAAIKLASATVGKSVTLTVTGDSTISDGTQSITLNMVTAAQNLLVMLSAGGWRLYSVSSAGALTYLGAGAGDAEAADSVMTFGKLSTASDNNDQKFSAVKTYVGPSFAFPWQPNKWIGRTYETEKSVNVAVDGSVETIHMRDDRYFSFVMQALSGAQIDTLSGYYTSYMADGTTFVLAEDQSDVHTASTWHLVKLLEKKFDPQHDSAVPSHYQLAWKLREVSS